MIGYVKQFYSNKTMSFVIGNKLLKKYTKIWERVSSLTNVEFDNEPVYGDNDKYIKANGDKINTNFQGKNIPKEDASYKCLSKIMLDSVIGINKNYPKTLLEEQKYTIKKNKTENLINDDLDQSSFDDKSLIMDGQNEVIHYQAFIKVHFNWNSPFKLEF